MDLLMLTGECKTKILCWNYIALNGLYTPTRCKWRGKGGLMYIPALSLSIPSCSIYKVKPSVITRQSVLVNGTLT